MAQDYYCEQHGSFRPFRYCVACTRSPSEAPPRHDAVEHPSHYTAGGVEVIDAIEAWRLGFHRGNAVKYIARAGKKDPAKELEDLRKARWYLDREISRLEDKADRAEGETP